jgi:23S rRNA G2069 N7-methylase RlmK/C1962 C5-methylase RlmI
VTDRVTSLKNRVAKNLARLDRWRAREGVTSFRVYDRDMPELPLAMDVYEGEDGLRRLKVIGFAPRHGGGTRFEDEVRALADGAGAVLATPPERCFLQVRERQRGGAIEEDDVAAATSSFFVKEGPARFLIRLGSRRDPGLFLDHRTTRQLVAGAAAGRSLLNLFAYTASFSVQAALAGAMQTTSVDLSPTTAHWAAENLVANGLDTGIHRIVVADVFTYLAETTQRFDMIVVDPPSVSRSKRATSDFDVQRDHRALLERCLNRLSPGGTLWFSTNLQRFQLSELPAGLVVDEITHQTVPPDFRVPPHRCFRVSLRGTNGRV